MKYIMKDMSEFRFREHIIENVRVNIGSFTVEFGHLDSERFLEYQVEGTERIPTWFETDIRTEHRLPGLNIL
jgi:hypothetical protein